MIQSNPLITFANKVAGTAPNGTGVASDSDFNQLKSGVLALQTEMLTFGIERITGTDTATYTIPANSIVVNVTAWNAGTIELDIDDFTESQESNTGNGCGFVLFKYVSAQTTLTITGTGSINASLIIAKSFKA